MNDQIPPKAVVSNYIGYVGIKAFDNSIKALRDQL
jgi:hypothetical protein